MRIQTHIDIAASAATCFDLSQDYALRPLWDSLTPHARPATAADGTRVAHCPAPLGMAFDVAYVSFQRPRVAAFRLLRGPWLFAALAGSWRFVPDGPGRCRVHFTYHLRLHRAVAWLLTPLVGRYVQRQSRQRLRALKRLAESLEPCPGRESSKSSTSRRAPFLRLDFTFF
ncbi:SRPBCC family protein [Allofranklinella schreckenbergeri]|uniref:SRPBCC family protein n=1 Tax=Allofranklinella schreckenbergeri TaxID=1076744 RepID=A0A3M6QE71_9BURK|nr:SRPBCC family protein [Allofranklinella schreckenbergeri]RMX01380.1 SRPBCC family protein [Allofranklinella schreckenbergeri]